VSARSLQAAAVPVPEGLLVIFAGLVCERNRRR